MAADGTALTLHQVINNNSLVPVFRLFSASLRLDDYLSFYLDAREFRNAYSYGRTLDGKSVEVRAREMFEKYFNPSSLTEIDMDPPVMEKLTADLEQPTGEMFDKAQRYAFEVLELKALREFVRSEAYKNFRKREKSLYQKREVKVPDIKEIEIQFKRIKDAQQHLNEIYTNISKKLASNTTAIQNGQALATLFIEYGESLQSSEDEDAAVLSECLLKAGQVMRNLEDLQQTMNRLLVQRFETPINEVLKGPLVSAVNQKKKYDKSAGKGDPKSTIAQETIAILRDTNNCADHQTFKSVCDMMELYLDYFEKGHKMLRKLIPSLMKYRNMIAQELDAKAPAQSSTET